MLRRAGVALARRDSRGQGCGQGLGRDRDGARARTRAREDAIQWHGAATAHRAGAQRSLGSALHDRTLRYRAVPPGIGQ